MRVLSHHRLWVPSTDAEPKVRRTCVLPNTTHLISVSRIRAWAWAGATLGLHATLCAHAHSMRLRTPGAAGPRAQGQLLGLHALCRQPYLVPGTSQGFHSRRQERGGSRGQNSPYASLENDFVKLENQRCEAAFPGGAQVLRGPGSSSHSQDTRRWHGLPEHLQWGRHLGTQERRPLHGAAPGSLKRLCHLELLFLYNWQSHQYFLIIPFVIGTTDRKPLLQLVLSSEFTED